MVEPISSTIEVGATGAIIVTELLEIIKKSPRFAWLSMESDRVNRVVGALAAFAVGLGIHVQFENGTLIISGLVAASVLHGLVQWAQQQAYYRLVVKQSKG